MMPHLVIFQLRHQVDITRHYHDITLEVKHQLARHHQVLLITSITLYQTHYTHSILHDKVRRDQ